MAVADVSAEEDVVVESDSAVPTFAVVSSTEEDDEPLPKRSFSLPALAHDATVADETSRRLTSERIILELASDDSVPDGGEARLREHDSRLDDRVGRTCLGDVLDSLADSVDLRLDEIGGVPPGHTS